MNVKSKGRGTAAAFGLLLLLAGVIGAVVLFVQSQQRPDQAIDEFARAPIGCRTTLEFTETGTFFVYEETGGEVVPPEGNCVPVADPASTFGFELVGDEGEIVPRRDDSIAYDTDRRSGRSAARFEIETTGTYEIDVRGDDPAVVAAIGRDPDEGVAGLRRGAIAVGLAGVVLGALLLMLAGRRSKRAADTTPPTPVVTPAADGVPSWPPTPPRVPEEAVTSLAPAEAEPPDPLPSRPVPTSGASPWAAPSPGDVAVDAPAPPPTDSSDDS